MRLLLAGFLFTLLPCLALADATQAQLLEIDSAFVQAQYSRVELLGLRLLQTDVKLSPQERSHVNLTSAYALIMLNREAEAREYFRHALDAEPNLILDPVQVSPKFRLVFDDVKAQHRPPDADVKSVDGGPVAIPFPSRQALLSNLIVPGSGQWREGHHLRGAAYFVAQAASVALLISQIEKLRDSHEDYLAQTDPARIPHAYDDYNHDYNLAWGAGLLTAAVYLAAQADLILFRPREIPVHVELDQSGNIGLRLALRW